MGERTYAIQAWNETLIDEIDRPSEELWMLEGWQLEGKKSRFARSSFSLCRTWTQYFSVICCPISENSTDLESCIMHKYHIKISAQYHAPFLRYDSKREPHFFYFCDSCTFWLSQKGKNMGSVRRKIGRLHVCLLFGMKTENFIKMTINKVLANTSRKNKSPCLFNLEVQVVRNRLRSQY